MDVNETKSDLRIPVQGMSDDDHVTIANTINDQIGEGFLRYPSN